MLHPESIHPQHEETGCHASSFPKSERNAKTKSTTQVEKTVVELHPQTGKTLFYYVGRRYRKHRRVFWNPVEPEQLERLPKQQRKASDLLSFKTFQRIQELFRCAKVELKIFKLPDGEEYYSCDELKESLARMEKIRFDRPIAEQIRRLITAELKANSAPSDTTVNQPI